MQLASNSAIRIHWFGMEHAPSWCTKTVVSATSEDRMTGTDSASIFPLIMKLTTIQAARLIKMRFLPNGITRRIHAQKPEVRPSPSAPSRGAGRLKPHTTVGAACLTTPGRLWLLSGEVHTSEVCGPTGLSMSNGPINRMASLRYGRTAKGGELPRSHLIQRRKQHLLPMGHRQIEVERQPHHGCLPSGDLPRRTPHWDFNSSYAEVVPGGTPVITTPSPSPSPTPSPSPSLSPRANALKSGHSSKDVEKIIVAPAGLQPFCFNTASGGFFVA